MTLNFLRRLSTSFNSVIVTISIDSAHENSHPTTKMMITDQEATELKSWVVKKLEDMYADPPSMLASLRGNLQMVFSGPASCLLSPFHDSSDADSDVLADYVLALIRADTPEPELRLNAIENLEDFLKESASRFRSMPSSFRSYC